ncbi:hypothetical protein LCGC14_1998560 [marine sediment metagenome]|uniref:Uncharacterized protein n=1 Tax=marine sediment metagenome TaxID=412755 RepID=A0A0F9HHB7_9ZZZZ
MLIYIYAGHVYCEDCGKAIQDRLKREEKAPADPSNSWSYHSCDYPKGPYGRLGGTDVALRHCEAGADCLSGSHGLALCLGGVGVCYDDLAIIDPWTDTLSTDEYLD